MEFFQSNLYNEKLVDLFFEHISLSFIFNHLIDGIYFEVTNKKVLPTCPYQEFPIESINELYTHIRAQIYTLHYTYLYVWDVRKGCEGSRMRETRTHMKGLKNPSTKMNNVKK